MTYNGLDIYEMVISTLGDGIKYISLVDEPAVERDFVCFSKEKEQEVVRFNIENDEKRLISGVLMMANYPILRINGDYKYYITYKPETIKIMAEKLLFEGNFKNTDYMHNNEVFNGMNLVELFIKDESKGIVPNYLKDIPDGSLIGTFHIENDELWNEIKNGNFLKGFSIEGMFTPVQLKKENNNNINTENKMKNIFKKMLVKFASVETDKGTLYYADELAVGVDVFVDNENVEVAADGEYETEEKVIVVADGKVTEIRDKEVETPSEDAETPAEEEVEQEEEVVVEEPVETPEETNPYEERIAALEEKVTALEGAVAELKEALAKVVEQPQSEPIEEEFENVKNKDVNRSLPKAAKKTIDLFKGRK